MPTWTKVELDAIPLVKRAYSRRSTVRVYDPAEWAKAAGMGYHSLKGRLAQLTLRYKKLKKEALHVWNDATEKYEPNPLYQGMF